MESERIVTIPVSKLIEVGDKLDSKGRHALMMAVDPDWVMAVKILEVMDEMDGHESSVETMAELKKTIAEVRAQPPTEMELLARVLDHLGFKKDKPKRKRTKRKASRKAVRS